MTKVFSSGYEIEAGVLTDVGNIRSRNEDSVAFIRPGNDQSKKKGALAIVADGMGGHSSGDIASKMAVKIIGHEYYRCPKNEPADELRQAFIEANRSIYSYSLSDPGLNGMGTTATALVLKEGKAHLVHVGDSRLYRLHQKQLRQISEDQTLAMALIKEGLLNEEQAKSFPEKNVITNALGTKPAINNMETVREIEFAFHDQFLLCSDGLHDLFELEELQDHLLNYPPQIACETLVRIAKERGGHDNISLIILKIDSSEKRTQTVQNLSITRA